MSGPRTAFGFALGLLLVGAHARAQEPDDDAPASEPPASEPPVVPEDPVPSPEAAAAGGATAPRASDSPGVEAGGYLAPGRPALGDELDPATQKEAWTKRTGALVSYEVRAFVTGLLVPNVGFSDVNPATGETETSRADQLGIGAGLGFRAGMMYVSLPDPASEAGALTGFRVGLGLDGSVLYSKPPSGFTYRGDSENITGRAVDRADKAYFYPTASAQLGFHVGFGKYRTPSIWRGMVLGVAYSPAYVLSLEIGKTEFEDHGFNYGGFELTLDVVSIEAGLDNLKPEMQIRLFALVLPKVSDDLPWLTSLGVGAVWY
jgi:hypothetical protein